MRSKTNLQVDENLLLVSGRQAVSAQFKRQAPLLDSRNDLDILHSNWAGGRACGKHDGQKAAVSDVGEHWIQTSVGFIYINIIRE